MGSSRKLPSITQIKPRTAEIHSDILAATSPRGASSAMSGQNFNLRKFNAGCDLFTLGERSDAVYDLVAGWVALYKLLIDGRRQIIHFALPRSILGLIPAAAMTYSAETLTPVVVRVISRASLCSLIRSDPDFAIQLAWLSCRDRCLAYDHLVSLCRQPARGRVARLLLELFIRSRKKWPSQCTEEMYLPLTQEHIADAIGLTGIHVNRVLQNLRSDGIVEFHHRHLRICNRDMLVDIANIDPHLIASWIEEDSVNGASALRQNDKNILTTAHFDLSTHRCEPITSSRLAAF